ncbi:MAG: hypothetical protein WCX31_21105 [Salinivirgaceae bacterium]|jgi:hypothetical protein
MEEKNKAFISKLDELIVLFAKLRDKASQEGILIKDDPLYKNFEMLSSNYQMIKNNIPESLIEELGEPIKQIISKMVEQLKRDLGINENSETTEFNGELESIDLLLKNKNLSEKEINQLLDKRTSINKDL